VNFPKEMELMMKAHMPTGYRCSDCGVERPSYDIYERRGQLFCGPCTERTAERRAYERWFVEPRS
jgi:hypothetical protein